MKKLVIVVTPAILLTGLVLSGLNDAKIAVADASTLDNEATSSVSRVGNSSTGATITITTYAVADE